MTAMATTWIEAGAGKAHADENCAHCGASLAPGAGAFCCAGCAAASGIIHGLGLDQFYARLAQAGARAGRPDETADADYAAYVVADPDGTCTLHVMLSGLTCAACVWLVESALARQDGIISARVNLSTQRLTIRWRGAAADAARHVGLVLALGFRAVPFDPAALRHRSDAVERELLRALAVAGFAAGNVMLLSVSVWSGHAEGMGTATRDLMHWLSALIALPAIAYAGRPFFRSALSALRAGRTNMDVPISIGVLLAAAVSLVETTQSGAHAYFDSAITLVFFLLVGRYLDVRARGRARSAVEHLLALRSTAVTVLRADGSSALLPPSAVAAGDMVVVAAGERIPVDGRVVDGRSDIDASLISGETIPIQVMADTRVCAGMINLTAPLRMVVTATGESTLLAEIVRLTEAAEQGRARFVVLADRVARLYAPVVHTLAAATFVGWVLAGGIGWQPALLNAIAVLIITCPCALGLAVPVVQVIASGRLLRRGILLKSATALERLAQVDTIVLDKTGTLTLGRPELLPDPSRDDAALRLAAEMAQASRHPLARAVVRACPDAPALAGVEERPGRGLVLATPDGPVRLGSSAFCEVDNGGAAPAGLELWLVRPGSAPVRFAFSDRLRPDAAECAARLSAAGYRLELLSGDRAATVAAAAQAVGIGAWRAACDPQAKLARLAELTAQGRKVLMVGDGLNDAPALAAAYVSASPSDAADVSQSAADAVFQGDRLAPIVELLATAKRSERLVHQNVAFAILYNVAAVPLAVAGYVTPLIAAVAMSSSSLLVIANAMRLAGRRRA